MTFYLEIQNHNMDVEKPILEHMPKIAKELGIKLVATNDCHYIEHDHATAHNILLLLGDKMGEDYTKLRYGTDQVYFKSAQEMVKLFKNFDGAIESTLEIDSKIDLKLSFDEYHFPNFPIPKDSKAKNLDEYFEQLAWQGLEKKKLEVTQVVEDRFKYEIDTIKKMGFSGYFLLFRILLIQQKKKIFLLDPEEEVLREVLLLMHLELQI